MSTKENSFGQKLEEDKRRENKFITEKVNDHIREFNEMLRLCEQRANKKSADNLTLTAQNDARTLRDLLDGLEKVKKEGHGGLPILRTQVEWDELNQMRQRYAQSDVQETESFKQSPPMPMIVYEENLRRLEILNRYNKKPRSWEEEDNERKKLINLALNGVNNFISYKDLEALAKDGRTFFLPPNSEDDACLSCRNGKMYRGSLSAIHAQLNSDLKADPGNANLKTGLNRIEKELAAKPNFALPKKENGHSDQLIDSQEVTYTTSNSLTIKANKAGF